MVKKNTTLSLSEIKWLGEHVATFEPLGHSQESFFISMAVIRWLFGGNQSGKTYSNMMDLAQIALNIHPTRKVKTGVHWVAIESWEQVRDILWENYLKLFIKPHHIKSILYGQAKVPRKLILSNGHIIEFKAFNQGRELFEGRAIDSCHCDEQCHHDFQGIFNEIQARLLKQDGFLSWSMTPILPQPFLEERIDDLPDTDEIFHADLNDNRISTGGYISDKRIDKMIADWPIEVQATRIKGRFASFYGAVYKTFNRQIHMIRPFKIPVEWPKYRSFDFGFTNPFVSLWLTKDKDENWYVYREYYQAQTGIQEHIQNINRLSGDETYIESYADPENAENRADMRKADIATRPARKDVAKGIEFVQTKLKVKENGKPSLFIFSGCKHTAREFAGYHYPQGTNANNPKDIPVQKNDHTLDALRYALYTAEKPFRKGTVYAA